jgi:arginine/lysine/ornithine decarboxylase
LAGNIFSEKAIKSIFSTKKRPFFNPLIVHIHSVDALKDIAGKNKLGECLKNDMLQAIELELAEVPVKKEKILISEAEGRIVADSVIPYPPGIPIACPGEILTKEVIKYAINQRKNGFKVMGIDSEEKVFVGK